MGTELTIQSWALCCGDWAALRLSLLWAHCLFHVPGHATASQPGKAVWGWGTMSGKAHGSWLTSAATAAFRADSSNPAERNPSNRWHWCEWLLLGITENLGCVCRMLNASWWMPCVSFGLCGCPSVAKLTSPNRVGSTVDVAEHPVYSLMCSRGWSSSRQVPWTSCEPVEDLEKLSSMNSGQLVPVSPPKSV